MVSSDNKKSFWDLLKITCYCFTLLSLKYCVLAVLDSIGSYIKITFEVDKPKENCFSDRKFLNICKLSLDRSSEGCIMLYQIENFYIKPMI